MKTILLVSIALLALSAAGAARASTGLTGDLIEGGYLFPDDATPYPGASYSVNPFTVGAGVDSVLSVAIITTNVDFSDDQLVLTAVDPSSYTSALFNGPTFSVLSGSPFGAISSVIASGGQSVVASIVGGVLQVNWEGQTFSSGDTVTVSFASVAAPEPSAWLMMLFGFAGLGFAGYCGSGRKPAVEA
jgi:hypothetical protein